MTFYEFIKSIFETALIENRELCITLSVIFICALLIHILIRPYRLWYWKINETNREITKQLKELNEKIMNVKPAAKGAEDGSGESELRGESCGQDPDRSAGGSGTSAAEDEDKTDEVFENGETISTSFGEKRDSIMSRGYNKDKQGKIYTEEEITKLIKD